MAALSLACAAGMGGCGSGSSSPGTARPSAGAAAAKSQAASEGNGGQGSGKKFDEGNGDAGGGDSSIKGYGADAGGASKAAVVGAVHSFLTAMARTDYEGMCSGLTEANREQLGAFAEGQGGSSGCARALKGLLSRSLAGEAQAAADAKITSVRIKGDTAFALFTPAGGSASYLVMKREGGKWKAISLTPGTPLEPTANS